MIRYLFSQNGILKSRMSYIKGKPWKGKVHDIFFWSNIFDKQQRHQKSLRRVCLLVIIVVKRSILPKVYVNIVKFRLPKNETFFALNLIMTFFRLRRNKHLCMLAFVYGEWWSGRNFSTDNEATIPPNLDQPIKKARMGVDSKL